MEALILCHFLNLKGIHLHRQDMEDFKQMDFQQHFRQCRIIGETQFMDKTIQYSLHQKMLKDI